jgi:hypothetical protein
LFIEQIHANGCWLKAINLIAICSSTHHFSEESVIPQETLFALGQNTFLCGI